MHNSVYNKRTITDNLYILFNTSPLLRPILPYPDGDPNALDCPASPNLIPLSLFHDCLGAIVTPGMRARAAGFGKNC